MHNSLLILFWIYWLWFTYQEFKVKLTSACLSLWTSYYFLIGSTHAFSFVAVYTIFMAKEGVVSLVIFLIKNIVSMYFPATWQFRHILRSWINISWGLINQGNISKNCCGQFGGLEPRDNNPLQPTKNQWSLLLLRLYYPNFAALSKTLTIAQERILSMTTGKSSFTFNINFLIIVMIKSFKIKFSLSPKPSKFYCTKLHIEDIILNLFWKCAIHYCAWKNH